MTEEEVHLKLSEIEIDNDNLDYIKLTGGIGGKLRDDLVKLFSISDVGETLRLEADFENIIGRSFPIKSEDPETYFPRLKHSAKECVIWVKQKGK